MAQRQAMSGAEPSPDPEMAEAAEDLGGRSRSAWFREGAKQALAGPMLVVAVSLISVGGLARDAGFSIEIAVASTILLWAGPAQVLFFGAVAAKTSWPAIAFMATSARSGISADFISGCVNHSNSVTAHIGDINH